MEQTTKLQFSKNDDRISILPDAILFLILAFLDMKTVVAMSVLSTRWRYICKSVSILKLDTRAFVNPETTFIGFVNTVLLLRDTSNIETFILYWNNKSKIIAKHLNTWILAALSRSVKVLRIEIKSRSRLTFKLPHQLFISESLTGLALDFDHDLLASNIFLPDTMCLPRLKSLALNALTGDGGLMWVNKLLSSCPVLNVLIIRDMWVRDIDEGVNIDCRELKELKIINTDTSTSFMARIIKLCTPNLTSFICRDYMLQEYSVENLSSLITSKIHMMKQGEHYNHYEGDEHLPGRMLNFLRGLRNVKELTLAPADFFQVVSEVPNLMECQSSHFHNLQSLTLEMYFTKCCLRTLTWLLKTSPYVEALYLTSEEPNEEEDDQEGDDEDGDDEEEDDEEEDEEEEDDEEEEEEEDDEEEEEDDEVGLSLLPSTLSHLKVIQIRKFKGCDDEIEFLELVLKQAVVLEKMDLFLCDGEKLPGKIIRKLEAISVSSSLTMKFHN